MEPTTIIVIVIFAICGLVLLWAIANGNNIKLKKKEKKSKSKPAKEEKFKDIVPKEKPAKPLKQKISKSAKDEKAGKKDSPTNKVVKVTKEDFKSNDLEVPKSLDDKKEVTTTKPEEFKFKIDDLNIAGDPTTKLVGDINFSEPAVGKNDFPLDIGGINDDLFLPPMQNDELNETNMFKNGIQDDFYKFDDNFPPLKVKDDLSFDFNEQPQKEIKEGQILNETLEARFNQVFGESLSTDAPKEVIVGEVLAGNRSRTNRELREKRLKKMMSNSLADKPTD